MVDQPKPIGPQSPAPEPSSPKPSNTPSNQWNPPPLTWLGMHFDADETKKLWNTIMQSVLTEIQRENDRMKKANQKLRKSETGQD